PRDHAVLHPPDGGAPRVPALQVLAVEEQGPSGLRGLRGGRGAGHEEREQKGCESHVVSPSTYTPEIPYDCTDSSGRTHGQDRRRQEGSGLHARGPGREERDAVAVQGQGRDRLLL